MKPKEITVVPTPKGVKLLSTDNSYFMDDTITDAIPQIQELAKQLDSNGELSRIDTLDGEVYLDNNLIASTIFHIMPGVFAIHQPRPDEPPYFYNGFLVCHKRVNIPPDIYFLRELYSVAEQIPKSIFEDGFETVLETIKRYHRKARDYYSYSPQILETRDMDYVEQFDKMVDLAENQEAHRLVVMSKALKCSIAKLLSPFVDEQDLEFEFHINAPDQIEYRITDNNDS